MQPLSFVKNNAFANPINSNQSIDESPVAYPPFNLDGWISVESDLPQPLEGRNFTDNLIVVDMNSAHPHATMARLHRYPGENVWSGCNVTHWMKTPNLPAWPGTRV